MCRACDATGYEYFDCEIHSDYDTFKHCLRCNGRGYIVATYQRLGVVESDGPRTGADKDPNEVP